MHGGSERQMGLSANRQAPPGKSGSNAFQKALREAKAEELKNRVSRMIGIGR